MTSFTFSWAHDHLANSSLYLYYYIAYIMLYVLELVDFQCWNNHNSCIKVKWRRIMILLLLIRYVLPLCYTRWTRIDIYNNAYMHSINFLQGHLSPNNCSLHVKIYITPCSYFFLKLERKKQKRGSNLSGKHQFLA